ncbi:uncharacterized protein EDB91DRAFT_1303280 [Suillus paluster]|uniref:uncharacterized protein n=1 Tax=Suillus paluster TaxID=48578 RepID=UPI001B871161|nr:uncharacterized protein EDB91DRAFT_1303280 [Suillus paluster]KAG1750358.1 hypothetical protein EDB91DRAFT_1303280 [Suillus paluster]
MGRMMGAVTLVQLPPELLCLILALLDAHDLVRVRKTCRALKALVDNSEMLQYIIDLRYFQMVLVRTSETDVPWSTRRKRLRQHDVAWQRLEYKQRCTLPSVMLGHTHELLGGIYGSAGEDCIYFARLPSACDSNYLHCWSHPFDTTISMDFTFSAAQDLLVVVAFPPDAATNPEGTRYIIDREEVQPISHSNVHIIGNYICILLWNITVNGVTGAGMQMWDWKSEKGYQFILLFINGINDCSFIAEDRFLILDTCGTMELYSFADKSKPPQCTAKLSLPSLLVNFSYTEAFTSDNITPGSVLPYPRKSYQPSCSFHPSMNDQLIAIHISVAGETNADDLHLYNFFTLRSAILELEGLFARTYGQPTFDGPNLLWSTWGPQHTTWFRVRRNEDWHSGLCGFHVVESISYDTSDSARESGRLRIRDFNPHIARNYDAQDKSDCRGVLVQGELTTTIYRPFTEPLGSALPYREIVSEELFDADSGILMDESRILLLKRDGTAGHQNIDVLVF